MVEDKMDNLARRLLIEQTRKEVLDELTKYHVGNAVCGEIYSTKGIEWHGRIFIIPDEKYNEWFKEG